MQESTEILFMQIRMIRMAAEAWNVSIQKANEIFIKYSILTYIQDCYGIFHTEGDAAVFEDIQQLLKNREVDIHAEINGWHETLPW